MTPRTVKAIEVVKGMRVEASKRNMANGGSIEIGGLVSLVLPDEPTETVYIEWDHQVSMMLTPDHPVTVLAEPEPEWVEGAWYRCQIHITSNGVKTLRRCVNGWSSFEQGPGSYGDDQVTVLGRVLIVDWPGDEHASELVENYGPGLTWDDFECSPLQKVADAIRTQGGVR